MAAAKMKYKRVPGGRRGFFRRVSLWLGDDHLLAVTGWRFTEDYKRYYYRDIQALVLARTRRWAVTLPWFVVAWCLAIFALAAQAGSVARLPEVFWYLLLALALAWLFVSLKASVRCSIQTAVSREELPSILRLWSAQRALRTVADRIAQAQGALEEGWTAHVREAAVPEAAPAPLSAPANGTGVATAARGRVQGSAIGLYISLALGGVLFYRAASRFWFVPILVQAGLAMVTLLRNDRLGGPRRTKVLMVATMSFVGAMAAAFYVRLAVEVFRAVASRRMLVEVPLNPVLVAIYTVGCLGLAVAGVLSAVYNRRKE
jgi:hypothetical protein